MQAFNLHEGVVAPLDRANVDTDLIIPKQFLKSIKRTGFGPNLFDELRYMDEGQPGQDCTHRPKNPDFILNQAPYDQASILLARKNFGCGSSREHAPWALVDFGFRAVIAPSFADIFFNNAFKNGLLPITLSETQVEHLFQLTHQAIGLQLKIDLKEQSIQALKPGEQSPVFEASFEVDEFRRYCLLEGLDDIGLTLRQADKIKDYEARRKLETPWLFE